jgi:hypothetical protein
LGINRLYFADSAFTGFLSPSAAVSIRLERSNIKNRAGENMLLRDINEVLSDHDDALMAIEGVVGVAVGLTEDGKTLCLKVLVARKTPELVRRIPTSIEGHPVAVEESGVIRPF